MGQILQIPIPGQNEKTDRCGQRKKSRLYSTDGSQRGAGKFPRRGESISITNRGAASKHQGDSIVAHEQGFDSHVHIK